MKKKTNIPTLLLFLLIVNFAHSQNFQWAKSIGSDRVDRVSCIGADKSGNFYIAGDVSDTVDFDPGAGVLLIPPYNTLPTSTTNDGYLAKYNADGNLQWAFHLGNQNDDRINDIKLDDHGNIYVTGYFSGFMDADPGPGTFYLNAFLSNMGVCIIKYDSSGHFVWGKAISGGVTIEGSGIAIDKSGNVIVTGYFSGSAYDFDPGPGVSTLSSAGSFDCFVLKLDTAGNYLWAKRMGGTGDDRGNAVAVDQNNAVLTTGQYSGTVDIDPGSNVFNLTGNNSSNTYIQKLDAAGNFIWAKSFNSTQYVTGISLVTGMQSEIYITGIFQGTVDFDPGTGVNNLTSPANSTCYIVKLGTSGTFKWSRQFIGGPNLPKHIEYDPQTAIFVTGLWSGTVDFDPGPLTQSRNSSAGSTDIFIEKLDTAGNYLWLTTPGQSLADAGTDIAVNSKGNIFAAGLFEGTMQVDSASGAQVTSKGLQDIYLIKYNQPFDCPKPRNLTSTGISSTSAIVNWNNSPDAISYQVRYKKGGTLSWMYTTSATNSKTLTGLLTNTSYQWQVRSKCASSPAVWSGWTSTRTFQTSLRNSDDSQFSSEKRKTELNVFPNPAHQTVTINFNAENDLAYQLSLINITGQLVETTVLLPEDGIAEATLDISNKAPGLYTIIITNGSEIEKTKLVIQ